MKEIKIDIQGMSCSSCVGSVEKTLKKIASVKDVKVSLENHSALIQFDENQNSAEDLVKAIEDIGYDASLLER